jgi:type I restriction enzyme, S subunit
MSLQVADSNGEQDLAHLLKDGVFIDGDWVESKDQDPNGEVRLIQLADIGDGYFRNRSSRFLTMVKAKELRCTFLEPGDILVARMPEPLGRACIFPGVGQPAVTAVDVCILRPNPARARVDWLVKAVNSPDFREAMQQFVRGTTRQRISRRNLGTLTFQVPPLDEQARLAQLIDSVQSKRGSGASHIAAARKAIERLREAVLAAACSGRLTADWRERNTRETATKLLEEVYRRRESFLGGKSKKGAAPADYDFAVPEGWSVTSLDRLSTRITSGSRDWSQFYGHGSGTFVMAQNVRQGYLDWSFRQSVDPPEHDASRERSQIAVGDLLITIVGANTGDVGPVTEDRPEHFVCQRVALVRPARAELGPFLNLWFNSPEHGHGYFEECIYGAGRPHLSFDQIKAAPVAVPPLDEQEEIARRVDQLLLLTDSLGHRIDLASKRVESASQAVLAKAFRGELVLGETTPPEANVGLAAGEADS